MVGNHPLTVCALSSEEEGHHRDARAAEQKPKAWALASDLLRPNPGSPATARRPRHTTQPACVPSLYFLFC